MFPLLRINSQLGEGQNCGPQWVSSIIPDIVLGFQFVKGCKHHDYFYSDDTSKSRWRADLIFYMKLRRIVHEDSQFFLHYLIGHVLAFMYFLAVRLVGWAFYKPYQNKAVKLIDKFLKYLIPGLSVFAVVSYIIFYIYLCSLILT